MALLFAAAVSCQKAPIEGEPAGPAEDVTISLIAPASVTKAIGDGANAKVVYFTAFVDGQVVPSLCQEAALDNAGRAVVNLSLVKNVNYRFVFWAQTPVAQGATPYYDLSSFYVNSEVKVDYAVNANDDQRDAFCAVQDIYVNGSMNVDVYLRRPFAQINFVASDYEMLKQLGLQNGMLSEMTVVGLPDTIKLLDGTVSSSAANGVDALFAAAPIPSGEDEYFEINGEDYGYIGMNYVLAPENGDNVSVQGRFVNGTSVWETVLLPNVPIRSNYKTNIFGELFVEHGQLQIIIQPEFNTPDNIVTM